VPAAANLAGYGELMGFHRHLLDDARRSEAFLEAVARVVKPGDVVADLGTGSGILAMAASRAGASRVYAIDHSSIILTARALAARNGFGDRIEFIADDSRRFFPATRVDVVVSECFGFMGAGGTMLPAVSDLIRRCLRQGGKVIPQGLRVYMAPVESQLHFDYVNCWESRYGFDFSAAQEMASNNLYVALFDPSDMLADPSVMASIDFLRDLPDGNLSGRMTFRARRSGLLHGFCGWFDAQLCPDIELSTSPFEPACIWQQAFLPLPKPIPVNAGAAIDVDLEICQTTGDLPMVIAWRSSIEDSYGDTRHFHQSTQRSFPGPVPA
jgi:hypothetical protein